MKFLGIILLCVFLITPTLQVQCIIHFCFVQAYICRENVAACTDCECETTCKESKDKFANSSAQFILCALENSRPIKLCKNCVDSYINVVESYNNMANVILYIISIITAFILRFMFFQISFNGTSCLERFINRDRLQIVNTMYGNTENLWSEAKCYGMRIYCM